MGRGQQEREVENQCSSDQGELGRKRRGVAIIEDVQTGLGERYREPLFTAATKRGAPVQL